MAKIQPSTSTTVKERLKQLLAIEEIEKVYFVDEEVGKKYSFEDFSGFVRAAQAAEGMNEKLQTLTIEGHSLQGDLDIVLSQIQTKWEENWNENQQRNAITSVSVLTDTNIAADAQQPSKLSALFGEDLVEYLTPERWKASKEDIITTIQAPKKVIVLFDEELKQPDERKGRDLIRRVKEQGWLDKIVPVLFSNAIQTYSEELTKRTEIIDEIPDTLSVQDFFVLSKRRTDNETGEDFADGIKKALLNRYCEQIKMASVAVLQKAFENAMVELNKLDTYHFDEVVLRSSHTEGIWEGFTIQRIARILFDDAIHKEMVTQGYVNHVNKQVRKAKQISDEAKFNPIAAQPYQEKYTLRRQEIYLDGTLINPLFFPIENGDIFEIKSDGKTELFILVGQECDLMVRLTGDKKAKMGILLPIKMGSTNLNKPTRDSDLDFKLHYFDGTKQEWLVKFNEPAIYANMDLLDLTALNPHGQAEMKFTEKLDENLFSFAWAKRYEIIREHLFEQMNSARTMLMAKRKKDREKFAPIFYPSFSFPENLLTPAFDGKIIELGLQRIKRLRQPYSKSLLEKFTRYQSRAADLHDFAKDR